uniref:Alternative protein EAPP n=1 Tax=Homo sapiens TaxID=9606 RepID=L8EAZ8_HUMAN|nr:alternative protein EAPP [Homo sapiens]
MKWMCFYMELLTKNENSSENVLPEKVNHLVKMNLKRRWKLN